MPTAKSQIKVTRIRNGAKGDAGESYQPIRIRKWDEIAVGDDLWPGLPIPGTSLVSPYTDVVYVTQNGRAVCWRCIKKCTKDVGWNPGDTYYNGYLQAFSDFRNLATDVLLAQTATIDLLSTNAIKLRDGNGAVVGEVRGCATASEFLLWLGNAIGNPLFGVKGTGHTFLGGMSGQRIELNPTDKTIRVFDTMGDCVAIHSGRSIDLEDAVPSDFAASAPVNTSVSFGSYYQSAGKHQTYNKGYTAKATSSGTLKIAIPAYTLEASPNLMSGRPGTTMEELRPMSMGNLRAVVTVDGTTVDSRYLGDVEGSLSISTTSTPATNISVNVKAGQTYSVKIIFELWVSGGTEMGGYVSATTRGKLVTEFVAKAYRCEYGANGWVISYDSKNYEYCLMIGGVLKRKIVSNGNTILTT